MNISKSLPEKLPLTDEPMYIFNAHEYTELFKVRKSCSEVGLSDLSETVWSGVKSLDPLDHINSFDYLLNTQITPFTHTFTLVCWVVAYTVKEKKHFLL